MGRTVDVSKQDSIEVLHIRLTVVVISVICICIYLLMKVNYIAFIMGYLMMLNGYVLAKIEEAYEYYNKKKKKIAKKEVKEDAE